MHSSSRKLIISFTKLVQTNEYGEHLSTLVRFFGGFGLRGTINRPLLVVIGASAPVYAFVGEDTPGGFGENAGEKGGSQGVGEGIVPGNIEFAVQPEAVG